MIERRRLNLNLDLDETLETERRRKAHARVNKNLLNRPLARDRRVKADWTFSKKHERWWCNLPGRKDICFRLPDGADRRLADGFDVAVLFLILRQARMSKSRKVKFASQAAMLRVLGRPVRVRYRRRLEQALTLWSQLSIRWKEWFHVAQYEAIGEGDVIRNIFAPPVKVKTKDAERVRLVLPPPIERMGQNTLDIVVSKAWLEQTKFECKVDLPLPMNAAVQNLILALLANPRARRRKRSWCRTAGLNHSKRNQRMPGVIYEVSKWFEQHKGEVVQPVVRDGNCWFIRLPKQGGSTTPGVRVHNAGGEGPQRRT
jgi:hypothetical protein